MKKMNGNPQISNVKYLDGAHFVPPLPRKKIILLFPEMQVTKKIFTRAAAKKLFFINLIEFFKQSLHLKAYSNSTFLGSKTKSPIFYCLKEENVNSQE